MLCGIGATIHQPREVKWYLVCRVFKLVNTLQSLYCHKLDGVGPVDIRPSTD